MATVLMLTSLAHAGGPLKVTYTPAFPEDAKPIVWANMPIHYRVDPGPFSSRYTNAQGVQRVQAAFDVWHSVSTANLSFAYDGALTSDVNSVAGFNAVMGACNNGTSTPVVFDADGSIIKALGYDENVIAFAGMCSVNANGSVVSGIVFLDGLWQDGVSTTTNGELTQAQFDEAVTHEIGHFLGLDHSQINLDTLGGGIPCSTDSLAGLPLMFPYAYCQARSEAGLPMLSPDDKAWISRLYPATSFATTYGTISGYIYFADGVSQLQGVNVIARQVDTPGTAENESRRVAVSVVSGYLFTSNPGQSFSAKYLPCTPGPNAPMCPPSGFIGDNREGGDTGSRNPALIGYFEIPVPPGSYTIQVENVDYRFDGGSSVGPLDPPVGNKPSGYWSESGFSSSLSAAGTITVAPGEKKEDINLALPTGTQRFDIYEGPGAALRPLDIGMEQGEEGVEL